MNPLEILVRMREVCPHKCDVKIIPLAKDKGVQLVWEWEVDGRGHMLGKSISQVDMDYSLICPFKFLLNKMHPDNFRTE